MSIVREMTCILCPLGCHLKVTLEEEQVVNVEGNSCPKGEAYAKEECTHPIRTLTTTMRVMGGEIPVISVKTSNPIPKNLLYEAMNEVNSVQVKAPIHIGDILIENLLGTDSHIVATRDCDKNK